MESNTFAVKWKGDSYPKFTCTRNISMFCCIHSDGGAGVYNCRLEEILFVKIPMYRVINICFSPCGLFVAVIAKNDKQSDKYLCRIILLDTAEVANDIILQGRSFKKLVWLNMDKRSEEKGKDCEKINKDSGLKNKFSKVSLSKLGKKTDEIINISGREERLLKNNLFNGFSHIIWIYIDSVLNGFVCGLVHFFKLTLIEDIPHTVHSLYITPNWDIYLIWESSHISKIQGNSVELKLNSYSLLHLDLAGKSNSSKSNGERRSINEGNKTHLKENKISPNVAKPNDLLLLTVTQVVKIAKFCNVIDIILGEVEKYNVSVSSLHGSSFSDLFQRLTRVFEPNKLVALFCKSLMTGSIKNEELRIVLSGCSHSKLFEHCISELEEINTLWKKISKLQINLEILSANIEGIHQILTVEKAKSTNLQQRILCSVLSKAKNMAADKLKESYQLYSFHKNCGFIERMWYFVQWLNTVSKISGKLEKESLHFPQGSLLYESRANKHVSRYQMIYDFVTQNLLESIEYFLQAFSTSSPTHSPAPCYFTRKLSLEALMRLCRSFTQECSEYISCFTKNALRMRIDTKYLTNRYESFGSNEERYLERRLIDLKVTKLKDLLTFFSVPQNVIWDIPNFLTESNHSVNPSTNMDLLSITPKILVKPPNDEFFDITCDADNGDPRIITLRSVKNVESLQVAKFRIKNQMPKLIFETSHDISDIANVTNFSLQILVNGSYAVFWNESKKTCLLKKLC